MAQDRREEGREEVGQRVVDDEKLHDARYASEEGNENGEETVHDDVLAYAAEGFLLRLSAFYFLCDRFTESLFVRYICRNVF